jgi:hypothetical protein
LAFGFFTLEMNDLLTLITQTALLFFGILSLADYYRQRDAVRRDSLWQYAQPVYRPDCAIIDMNRR